jgi:hypothetical protein
MPLVPILLEKQTPENVHFIKILLTRLPLGEYICMQYVPAAVEGIYSISRFLIIIYLSHASLKNLV